MKSLVLQFNQQKTTQIAVVCFFAPIFYYIFINLFQLSVDRLIGFTASKPSAIGVAGCPPEYWMHPVRSFAGLFILLTFMYSGYRLSRKGFENLNLRFLLSGAFLFFPVVNYLFFAFRTITQNPLWFTSKRETFLVKLIPFIGNFYYYRWLHFWLFNGFILIGLYLSWRIVSRYWDKQTRLVFLLFGSVACASGYWCWFHIIGPWLFPFKR